MIPYGRQDISEEDIQAVVDVLRSDYLTQGPVVPAFEEAIVKHCGASYGVAVNSATSALHIACMSLGVQKGDIVWTSPITFVASANCAIYCGAMVDFVDIDDQTYNMSVTALTQKLIKAEQEDKLPKVVIPVHLSGQSCDMEKIHALSIQYGFRIIEDASHGIGGKYKGDPIGNCKYSDITIFSFHPVKIITTGEGGMCVTNNEELALHLARLRSHGITRQPSEMTHAPDGPWYYQQLELGYNYRMTDMQAALGLSQMSRLDEFVKRRHAIAKKYDNAFTDTSIRVPYQHPDSYSAFHLYIIQLKQIPGKRVTNLQLFEKLRAVGILVNLHYIPVYRHPYYVQMNNGYDAKNFPVAEAYYSGSISIPMHTKLTEEEQDFVIEHIKKPIGHQNLF